ncbi:hypothetical protein K438DRAFT_1757785 [Mycena galopus ATCC 62051]|nr:hypothetical protein K438DRAFT_1757785 [Mycena galopus ATCC 62051]
MASRLTQIGWYLERNIGRSTTNPNNKHCLDVFTKALDFHLKQDVHWLANHFIPRLPLDAPTSVNEVNGVKKRKVMMDTEQERGRGEQTVSKDGKAALYLNVENQDRTESVELNTGALKAREWRHKLQKTFLSSTVLPKEDDMPVVDMLFNVLEMYGGMNIGYLNSSKIGKVMRPIHLRLPNRVTWDDEFRFRDRAGVLVNKWHNLLNSNYNSTDAAETEVKAESATEHTVRMDVHGPGIGGADDSGSDLE